MKWLLTHWLRQIGMPRAARQGAWRRLRVERLEDRLAPSAGRVGPEFRVNTFTPDDQRSPAVGLDADGDFVIAWESYGQDGSHYGIYAQRYSAAGVPQGPEFRVNTLTVGRQDTPAVAMDSDGDFVIAWESDFQDGSGEGIYAQRYSAAGVPQGPEFRVNTFTAGSQQYPAVVVDADGDFVIAWESPQDGSGRGIYAQRYNAAGVPQGTEFQVNSYITGAQGFPAVGLDADGDFLIAWESLGQDGSFYGIYAQRYDAAGAPQGPEFRANTFTAGDQRLPAVGLDADGDFLIAWSSVGQDGSGAGVYAQLYSAAGVPQGGEFRANSFTTGDQWLPAVGLDANGEIVITWQSGLQDGSREGIYARLYSAAGVPQSSEFQVNSYTTGAQGFPAVGLDADGDFVIAWESDLQEGSREGIYAQRYVVDDDVTLPGTDGDDTIFLTDLGAALEVTINATTTSYSWASLAALTINTGAGIDLLWQEVPSVPAGVTIHLNGGADLDVLIGPAVATTWTITGSFSGTLGARVPFTGMDHLYAGAGDDTFVLMPGGLVDFLWGGLGSNRVDYSAYTTGVLVILGNNPGGYDCNPGTCGQATGSTLGLGTIQNVIGSPGDDILVGDHFGNRLEGGLGRDLLIGGGYYAFIPDELDGGAGDDIVIGGFTDYDADPTHLEAIRASWTRPAVDYTTRVNELRSGTGAPRLDATTVHYNYGLNTLRGGAGRDFFFSDPFGFDTRPDREPLTEVLVEIL